jgi:glycosyltransferase involved in cell wall biosynthesis
LAGEKQTSLFFLVPDPGLCGDTAAARLLALGLPRDRFRVAVGILGSVTGAVADELRRADVALHSVQIRHIFDLNGVRRLRHAVRESGAAVVHTFGSLATRVSRLIVSGNAEGNTPRLVVSGTTFPGGGLGGWLTSRQIRRADRVISATRADGERYRHIGVRGERLTLIAPAAPTLVTKLDQSKVFASLAIPPDARIMTTSGSSQRGIGPRDAIIAFDMLRYDARDLHLVVFGAGTAANDLEQFGRALAFDDFRVKFASAEANRAAAVQLATLVLVVNPRGGIDEALEAMAAGKPVVGWNTPDLAEVVDDTRTGFLVPVGDRAALAAKTRVLIDDPAIAARMGEAGRVRATERFATALMVEHFARLYDELGGLREGVR